MKKLKVVHYCNQLSLGGTEKTMEIFAKHLDRSRFDVHVVSRIHSLSHFDSFRLKMGSAIGHKASTAKLKKFSQMNARVDNFILAVGADHIHFAEDDAGLRYLLLELKPD